ncbi:MAG: O-methyltransferase [Campylobacterota bacterium]|nr:O-methyltransferase [Campylobacterota bacterium]
MNEHKPSFEKINYSLRVAKNIERKMIVESLPRLKEFNSLDNYTYIGFGSPFFTDFILFHKQLGIKKLISIEKEEEKKERFEFNKPFNSIQMIYKHSTHALQNDINHQDKKIIWLDYDYQLDYSVLIDVEEIAKKSTSGDMLLITLNANANQSLSNSDTSEAKKIKILNKFKEKFSFKDEDGEIFDFKEFINPSISYMDIESWGYSKECKIIISNLVEDALKKRNLAFSENLKFKIIYNFNYSDGADMLTVGYIFYDNEDEEKLNNCNFDNFSYCKDENQPYLITAPKLTLKELHHIDYYLPDNLSSMPDIKIDEDDLEMYEKIYRYYPSFIEGVR